tara:strand:- start:556 stop:981 length:426 start_codon:yes stop_codon:yes gene_type:complete
MGLTTRGNIKNALRRSHGRYMDDLCDSMNGKADHWVSNATAPTIAATTAGNGACAIASTSTDVCGTLTFTNTWADSDTLVLTYATAYDTAPIVIINSCGLITAAGVSPVEIDTVASATTAFTLTASGTCAGAIQYLVIEAV